MPDFQHRIPNYLIEKHNLVKLVVFTALFALLFINFYAPFGVKYWFDASKWRVLAYSSLIILTGVLVVALSRLLMYLACRRFWLNYWHYFIWVFVEVLAMAAFYAIFEKFILHDPREFLDLLKGSAQNTALVLLLPYSALWLYFSWKEKKDMLELVSQNRQLVQEGKNMVPFHDEKGELQFSVKTDDLLYLESADNYVKIYYISSKSAISHFTLRSTLKRIEDTFKGTELVRCHRSFIVNFSKVKVIRKEKDSLLLELDATENVNIPVSKTYAQNVLKKFSSF